MRESTALGAAVLAGLAEGVGVWNFSKSEETYQVFKSKITEPGTEIKFPNYFRHFRVLIIFRCFQFERNVTKAGKMQSKNVSLDSVYLSVLLR